MMTQRVGATPARTCRDEYSAHWLHVLGGVKRGKVAPPRMPGRTLDVFC
ncbi:hypothetical protein BLA6860_04180 [Burkholderia lata]|nr:hypothetical protein BLA6860_04180 [Burkholderia lata]